MARFLTGPAGDFYTSQDADLVKGEHSAAYFALGDAARAKRGIPAVDRTCSLPLFTAADLARFPGRLAR